MIHIINRHCTFSNLSSHKERPEWFSRKKCFLNLVKTLDNDKEFKHHVLLDGNISNHFLSECSSLDNLIILESGSGAKSFVDSVQYALSISKEDDYIYFLEDDYLHRPGWTSILKEGMTLGNNTYFTLYDHPDKYPSKSEEVNHTFKQFFYSLQSKIIYTDSVHWRTTPATTDTFIISKNLLNKYKENIIYFSTIANHSLDYSRSIWLEQNGIQLWSCLPGYSAHITSNYESPLTDWKEISNNLI